jgi:hypothetical protein
MSCNNVTAGEFLKGHLCVRMCVQIMGDGPMRFDGLETIESRQQWAEDMDVDVSYPAQLFRSRGVLECSPHGPAQLQGCQEA